MPFGWFQSGGKPPSLGFVLFLLTDRPVHRFPKDHFPLGKSSRLRLGRRWTPATGGHRPLGLSKGNLVERSLLHCASGLRGARKFHIHSLLSPLPTKAKNRLCGDPKPAPGPQHGMTWKPLRRLLRLSDPWFLLRRCRASSACRDGRSAKPNDVPVWNRSYLL